MATGLIFLVLGTCRFTDQVLKCFWLILIINHIIKVTVHNESVLVELYVHEAEFQVNEQLTAENFNLNRCQKSPDPIQEHLHRDGNQDHAHQTFNSNQTVFAQVFL